MLSKPIKPNPQERRGKLLYALTKPVTTVDNASVQLKVVVSVLPIMSEKRRK